jgi:hypothetical protein
VSNSDGRFSSSKIFNGRMAEPCHFRRLNLAAKRRSKTICAITALVLITQISGSEFCKIANYTSRVIDEPGALAIAAVLALMSLAWRRASSVSKVSRDCEIPRSKVSRSMRTKTPTLSELRAEQILQPMTQANIGRTAPHSMSSFHRLENFSEPHALSERG